LLAYEPVALSCLLDDILEPRDGLLLIFYQHRLKFAATVGKKLLQFDGCYDSDEVLVDEMRLSQVMLESNHRIFAGGPCVIQTETNASHQAVFEDALDLSLTLFVKDTAFEQLSKFNLFEFHFFA
jgi:hypothetical protein